MCTCEIMSTTKSRGQGAQGAQRTASPPGPALRGSPGRLTSTQPAPWGCCCVKQGTVGWKVENERGPGRDSQATVYGTHKLANAA